MKQRKRGKIRVVGIVQRRDTGRPEIAYGRRCKPNDIEHEVRVADLELILKVKIERGVQINGAEPDGAAEIGGRTCYVEVDHSGKMTAGQMKEKWRRYCSVVQEGEEEVRRPPTDCFILVVAMNEGRMKRLMDWSGMVREVALFTTFARLKNTVQPWVDCTGGTVRM